MFERILAADMGSSMTRLASRSGMTADESRAALDPSDGSRVLAFGEAGRKLLGANEAYPIRGGVADVSLAALMLRRFALRLLGRKSLPPADIVISAQEILPARELASLIEVGREAGFRRVLLADGISAGAVGAGMDVFSRTAHMIADIGRESLRTAFIANGGVICQTRCRCGSVTVDKSLQAWFASEHRLLISARTAERLKKQLDCPTLRVSCREALGGMPVLREFRSSELREAANESVRRICSRIAEALNLAPPDAAGDVCENGITLIGGGALQYGLAEEISKRMGVPVRTAANAPSAVILGLKLCFESGEEELRRCVGIRAAGE